MSVLRRITWQSIVIVLNIAISLAQVYVPLRGEQDDPPSSNILSGFSTGKIEKLHDTVGNTLFFSDTDTNSSLISIFGKSKAVHEMFSYVRIALQLVKRDFSIWVCEQWIAPILLTVNSRISWWRINPIARIEDWSFPPSLSLVRDELTEQDSKAMTLVKHCELGCC